MIMTINSFKFKNSAKSFLNNSITNACKLNKSRSLLQNSILRCTLKTNNSELAKSLASKEEEICELRKENNRLLKENFDIIHTGQFRTYNYESFMIKFYELSENTITLFNEVSKLSDSVLSLQNHPFIAGNNVDNNQLESIPSPFISKDKINRSPEQRFHVLSTTVINNPCVNLGPQIQRLKDQSAQSIHNLSMNLDTSVLQKPGPKLDPSDTTRREKSHTRKSVLNKSFLSFDNNPKITECKNTGSSGATNIRSIKKGKIKDPMFSTDKDKKKTVRRKKNILPKAKEREAYDRTEYIRKKQEDAFYLSQNQTINDTIIPPTLNEFKGQLDNQSGIKMIGGNEIKYNDITEKLVTEPNKTSLPDPVVSILPTIVVNSDNDSDDFVVSMKPKKKPTKAIRSIKKNTKQKINDVLSAIPIDIRNDAIIISDSEEVNVKRIIKSRSKNKISKEVLDGFEKSGKKLDIISNGKENVDLDRYSNDTSDSKPVLKKSKRMPRVNYCITPPKKIRKN